MATSTAELLRLAIFGIERVAVGVFSNKTDRQITSENNPATLQFFDESLYLLCPCNLHGRTIVRLRKPQKIKGIKWVLKCKIVPVSPSEYTSQMRAIMTGSSKTLFLLKVESVGLN